MKFRDDWWREEFKYWITADTAMSIRDMIQPHMRRDPHIEGNRNDGYIVRSIYYDTPGFDFYYQKLEGLRVRKKLRVRGYNHTDPHGSVFLEIKHKMGRKVFKERAFRSLDYSMRLLDTDDETPDSLSLASGAKADLAERRFLWHKYNMGLMPAVLVVYDRIAYVGQDDSRIRVTMDSRVRSTMFPTFQAINDEHNLEECSSRGIILELKFNGAMPGWMVDLVRGIGLAPTSISKYAMCVEHWMNGGCTRPEELHALAQVG